MRVLAIYYDYLDEDVPKCLQVDVSRERGIWELTALLSSGHVLEIRFIGETASSVGLIRMLVRVGQYKRPKGPNRQVLRVEGDEVYPRTNPFVFICPGPDPAAFD